MSESILSLLLDHYGIDHALQQVHVTTLGELTAAAGEIMVSEDETDEETQNP